MSKKKKSTSSKKEVTKKIDIKKIKDEDLNKKNDLEEKEITKTKELVISDEKSTIVGEDKSFEKLFEKEMEDKKVRDSVRREKYREEKAMEKERDKVREVKIFKHPIIHTFLILVLLTSLAYFIISLFYNDTDSLSVLISSLLLMVFTILYISNSIKLNKKSKSSIFFSSLVLCSYFVFGILSTMGIITFPGTRVIDFSGKSLTEVIKWSEKNKIDIVQVYEYSDMIAEYHIINQDVKAGTRIKNVDSITIAISEGANPSKEIMVPNMVSWDSERVLAFVKENHLSNVIVEFVESSKAVNTVIEQSKSGNMKRDEELKLMFSYGEELEFSEVKLKDLSGMSKFEATFYLKQNHLNYEFEEVFSSKIKKGFVVKQSVKAGEMVKVNDDKIIVYISKGPEIKVPNLVGMSMSDITDWVISNKLKLEFSDKYDDTIKENSVISANVKQGDVVSEGTVIKVVISRGKLIMPEFENYDEFREWADKYEISYDEQHEFSDSVAAGKVISYSYEKGETIKNNDTIIVKVSDGKESSVPNVVNATKANAKSKLENAGFRVNYVYKCSTIANGNVIRQSISAGSKVAQGTTITLTISTGKCAVSNSGGNSGNGGNTSKPSTPPTPICDTSKGATFYVGMGNNGSQVLSATKAQNPGFTITANYVDQCPNGDANSGAVCNSGAYDGKWISYCTKINLTIVR